MNKPTLKTTENPMACLLILQPGKTYVTKGGDEVTMELNCNHNGSYPFIGDNDYRYTENGCIFTWGEPNDLDISHELQSEVSHCNGNLYDNALENLTLVTLEENRQLKLIDVLKFKQKSNGTKRKLTLKDYSDDTVEIIFKTKFSKDEPQVTTGIRLSYDAVLMLYDSLEYMLEENKHALH